MTEPLFRDDAYLKSCDAVVTGHDPRGGVILDRTVFYATGGGQPGDRGRLVLDDGSALDVVDAVKGETSGEIAHILAEGSTLPVVGAKVKAELDWDRRYAHMRMHSCLHLLSAVLPYPVTGGQVGAEKSRLDFFLPDPPDKQNVTDRLNALIAEDIAVEADWISDQDLAANPELVKTMSVKPPSGAGRVRLIRIGERDLQPCGGIHVKRTGEIGAVFVRKIESKGKQNRRVVIAFAE
ncbi:MAG: alanyl-tRNA editing protein [Parvularculaceae bacterium]